MMRLPKVVLSCAIVVVLGCEREYGVHRTALLQAYPDLACIRGVIERAPGIGRVTETSPREPRTTGAPRGSHYFSYEGPSVSAHLAVVAETNGEISLSQTLMQVDSPPPQEMIDATRAVMRSLERQLENDCAMNGLASSTKEFCFRVDCGH
jgi:hypothetical protein